MELKISIKTPKGYAKSTEFKLRPWLIGRNGKLHKIMTNAEDNQILWIVDAEPRRYSKIIKNVSMYGTMIKGIMNNKLLRRAAKLSKEGQAELDDMLMQQTTVDIIRENELQEIMKEFKDVESSQES